MIEEKSAGLIRYYTAFFPESCQPTDVSTRAL